MENSKISWTTHTFSPWRGCQRTSPGCENCYAEALLVHRYKLPLWGPKGERRVTSDANWRQPLKWNREAQATGMRARVFCSSLADVFEDRPELAEPRLRLAKLIAATPHLDWLLLTKRPENMVRMGREMGWLDAWPENVWAGTTCENQTWADKRIPHLLQVPARVRFLSVEPQLGPINLRSIPANLPTLDGEPGMEDYFCALTGRAHDSQGDEWGEVMFPRVHWVIQGGESGTDARLFRTEWMRDLRDQCKAAGVAYFAKQLGARPTTTLPDGERWPGHTGPNSRVRFSGDGYGNHDVSGLESRAGSDPDEWPEDLRVQEFPT